MNGLELAVVGTVVFILIASTLLALQLTLKYEKSKRKAKPLFWWSAGLWLFALGVLLELLFAFGIYSEFLIAVYLFIVGILVLCLSLGSIELAHNNRIKLVYKTFSVIAALLLLGSLVVSPVGNIITDYVVYGNLPLLVIITSIVVTFPASAVLIVMAAKSYMVKRNLGMLAIIAGVIIVAIAGTLYVVSVPEFLYASEFFGILLLWIGFNK